MMIENEGTLNHATKQMSETVWGVKSQQYNFLTIRDLASWLKSPDKEGIVECQSSRGEPNVKSDDWTSIRTWCKQLFSLCFSPAFGTKNTTPSRLSNGDIIV